MDDKMNNLLYQLNKWRGQDNALLQDGTNLICLLPHISPLSYLHQIYPPLNTLDIEKIETILKVKLPDEYIDFLLRYNGIDMFSSNISIFGLKKSKERIHFNNLLDPKDIIVENLSLPFESEYLIFASYNNGYDLFFDKRGNKKVYVKAHKSDIIFKEYPSFYEWIQLSIDKLSLCFHENGKIRKEYQMYKSGKNVNCIYDVHQIIDEN